MSISAEKAQLIEQLDAAIRLTKSPEWTAWVTFLKKDRKGFLQNKANEAVREGDMSTAQIYLALKDDCDKQIELFMSRIKGLESEIKQGAK